MAKNDIKQLAFTRGDGKCPVCGKVVYQNKVFEVELHDSNRQSFAVKSCNLLYCGNCDLPLVDGRIISSIYAKTGMRPATFSTAKNKLSGIKNQMYYKKKSTSTLVNKENNRGYRIIGRSTSIWKPYTRLYAYADEQKMCSKCHQQLLKGETVIPISENSNLLVEGLVCHKCKAIFVKHSEDIAAKLKDNPYSRDFYLNDIAYWQYTENVKKKKREERIKQKAKETRARKAVLQQRNKTLLASIESSVVLISVAFQDGGKTEFIIATNKDDVKDEHTTHYSSAIGRELLSAAYAPMRKKQGNLNGRDYRVISTFLKGETPESILPSFITIKSEGGLRSSIKNNNFELVDLLLYSPYNNVYECIHATHDVDEGFCYLDISLYRRFVREYGNPGLWLDFPAATSAKMGELNEESILRGYGYSVSKAENLSDSTRKELLSELVDLEILTVAKIVHHLDFCIHLHTEPRYADAVHKWKSDKLFIENYKVNPARFMLSI